MKNKILRWMWLKTITRLKEGRTQDIQQLRHNISIQDFKVRKEKKIRNETIFPWITQSLG